MGGVCVVVLAGLAGAFIAFHPAEKPQTLPPPTYRGSSTGLRETVILATLDSPIPAGKSAIWCLGFELAWRKAREEIFKGPIRTKNGTVISERLNASSAQEEDVDPQSLVLAAGILSEGLEKRIQDEFRRKFPHAAMPVLDVPGDGLLSYAYLAVQVPFALPFFENTNPLRFKSAEGVESAVRSFGIRREDDYAYFKLRNQVSVLFSVESQDGRHLEEFAVDPCRTSDPYQLVLAVVPPQPSLADAVARVERLAAQVKDSESIGPNDTLLIPNLNWEIDHEFSELEGPLLNSAVSLVMARQTLRFTLNRSGADLAAEAKELFLPIPRHFHFDRPFLIILRKRGAARPYFAMWVADEELLESMK